MPETLQTPFFLIRERLLRANIEGFRSALDRLWPNSIIAYSVKTNALPWILSWMNRHGVYAEVVSDEEFRLAELSGFPANRIVFNGPLKSDGCLKKAFENRAVVNVDSAHELAFLSREHPQLSGTIGIRVNVNTDIFNPRDVEYQEDGFRFGFSEENGELQKAINRVRDLYGDIPIGLHLHVNSITRAAEVYRLIAEYGAAIIRKYSLRPAFFDIGGGFFGGVPGKTTPEEYISTIKAELEKVVDPSFTKLIIEPGSAAVGSAIEYHTAVVDVKDTAKARMVTTDGSRIHIDPLWLKKSYLYSTDSMKSRYPRQIICGYTCMDRDRLMVLENEAELSVGDRITCFRTGNYTVTFGGPFIKPFPPVYVEDDDGIRMVRRQMGMDEYYRMETV